MKRIALVLTLCACQTPPVTPTADSGDAAALGDAGGCEAMCANLAAIGCKEGRDPKCVAICAHDLAQPVTMMPVACWANAPTKQAARACGDASTGHVACE